MRTQAEALWQDGWTKKAIKDGYIDTVNAAYDPRREMSIDAQLTEFFNDVHTFGSGIFQKMWGIDYQTAKETNDSKAAEKLLGIAMKYTGMPPELNGSAEQTQAILDKMSDSLAPDDDFWDDFAGTVQVAYPDDSMSSEDGNTALKQKVHQFRYVISAQQAQWVRDNYKKDGMTDEEALAAYLSTLEEGDDSGEYSLDESSRLHNKMDKNGEYPDSSSANYKVTIGFHSEFIVDENGNFLNEIDPHKEIEDNTNGIVNGASFNYANANDGTHIQMDVHTAKYLDPSFRDIAGKYKSPNNLNSNIQDGWEDFWGSVQGKGGNGEDWNSSYWNSRGAYSKDGISAHDRVEKERENFRKMIKNY